MESLDEIRRRLYGRSPDEFVAARNAEVRDLKKAKRRDDAAAINAERRPSRVVWALRRASDLSPAEVTAYVDAARAVHAAQGGGGGDLRALTRDLRAAIGSLATAVAASSGEDRADVASGLLGLAGHADLLDDLAAGLLRDLPTSGSFGPLPESMPAASPSPSPSPSPSSEAEPEREPEPPKVSKQAIARADARVKRATEARARAQKAVAGAEEALDAARRLLAAAEDSLAEAEAARAELLS